MTVKRYASWLQEEALLLWLRSGVDPQSSLFFEKLHFDGSPDLEAELRVRTQFRQIYVFAHAALLGLLPSDTALEYAGNALTRVRALAWAPDGKPGWVHRIRRDGTVADSRRDLYDHAFVLHGLAWMRKATGEPVYGAWIDETLAFVDEGLRAPAGGWAESDKHELPRRQNPHMHFFEACIALYETSGDAAHLARAGEIFGLFTSRFFDDELGVLREHFGPEWQLAPEFGSNRIEPGHMMEWVWLLRRYARSSRRRVGDRAGTLFSTALRIGLDPKSGFLPDEVDPDGKPLVDGRRLWVQTEYLKALLVEHEATGDGALLTAADTLCDRLLRTYLTGTVAGGFRDRFTLAGELAVDHIPASIPYHLFAPLIEILRLERQGGA